MGAGLVGGGPGAVYCLGGETMTEYSVGLLSDGSERAQRFRRVLEHFDVAPREIVLDELEEPEVVTESGVARTIEDVEDMARSMGG